MPILDAPWQHLSCADCFGARVRNRPASKLNIWVRIVSEYAARRERIKENSFGQISSHFFPRVTIRCEDGNLHQFLGGEFEVVSENKIPASAHETVMAGNIVAERSTSVKAVSGKHGDQKKERLQRDEPPTHSSLADPDPELLRRLMQEKPWDASRSSSAALFGTLICQRCKNPSPVPANVAASGAPLTYCKACAYKIDKLGRKRWPRARRKSLTMDPHLYQRPRPAAGMTGKGFTAPPVDVDARRREWKEKRARVKSIEDKVLDIARKYGFLDPEELFILRKWKDGSSYREISEALDALGIRCSKPNVPNLLKKIIIKLRRRHREVSALTGFDLETAAPERSEVNENLLSESLYDSTGATQEGLPSTDQSELQSQTSGTPGGRQDRPSLAEDPGHGSTKALIEENLDDLDSEGADILLGLDRDSDSEDK